MEKHKINIHPGKNQCAIKDCNNSTIMTITELGVDFRLMNKDALYIMIWNDYEDIISEWYRREAKC